MSIWTTVLDSQTHTYACTHMCTCMRTYTHTGKIIIKDKDIILKGGQGNMGRVGRAGVVTIKIYCSYKIILKN